MACPIDAAAHGIRLNPIIHERHGVTRETVVIGNPERATEVGQKLMSIQFPDVLDVNARDRDRTCLVEWAGRPYPLACLRIGLPVDLAGDASDRLTEYVYVFGDRTLCQFQNGCSLAARSFAQGPTEHVVIARAEEEASVKAFLCPFLDVVSQRLKECVGARRTLSFRRA